MAGRDRLTAPVATVRCAKEEVLQDDGNEVPEDDLAAEYGLVEGGHLSRGLAIVVGKSEEQQQSNSPEEDCNRVTDGTKGDRC